MRWFAFLALLVLAAPAGAQAPRVLDDFSRPAVWRAQASDGVGFSSAPFEGGLRLNYDFTRGSGYAVLRRALPLTLPANFELRFRIRGQGAANALEVKLTDASGENVWWHRRADYAPPDEWQTIRIRRRQIDFAWGPTRDRTLRRTAAVEFVVAAGPGGGRGWIAVDDLEIVPLPVPPAVPPPVRAAGSGARAIDGDRATFWLAHPDEALTLDLRYRREFGGLVLRWLEGRAASDYDVAFSDDGRTWREVRSVRNGDGGTDWLKLPESEARYVRIRMLRGLPPRMTDDMGSDMALAEVEVRPLAFGASDNAFVAAIAAEAPRGDYPRGFVDMQSYWTLVANPEGGQSGLIDEDGAIEAGRGGFSVEPFVSFDGSNEGWADVRSTQMLSEDGLPVPTVVRHGNGWTLAITAIPDGNRIVARYRLRNERSTRQLVDLVLAVRPFQVNPPQQFLNITGGVSPIHRLAWREETLAINGVARLRLAARRVEWAPDVMLSGFDTGPSPTGRAAPIEDGSGLASARILYSRWLEPGGEAEVALSLGLDGAARPVALEDVAAIEAAAAARWRAARGDVRITGPAAARPALDTLRTALAHILATREGPALRPGSRSYARAWIRDGTMMSSALLRMGLDRPAIDFLNYYAPYQYPDGKVPCCVDARGADPVPENDSDGELIHLVREVDLYAPDLGRLQLLWPHVRAAADHIETLRQSTRIAANRAGRNRPLYGLLPPSISHEGYSARPAYSYWDDFWALTGLEDAAWLAGALGRRDEALVLGARAQEFRADILASLAAAREVHRIDFIPGAADLGDFDATSTTIALAPAGLQHRLPAAALTATFERYWAEFTARRDGRRTWDAYTPYEWRNVGAMVRLGWRTRANALFDWFMADRRPAGWNQWAEVVGRDPRAPRFIGDMPHGWVASDYVNALLDMLAYGRPRDDALVLAAGVPDAWLAGDGIAIQRLRTPYGLLSYSLRADSAGVHLAWRLDGRDPPGGLVLALGAEHRLTGLHGEAVLPR